jgi:hypothetical protein
MMLVALCHCHCGRLRLELASARRRACGTVRSCGMTPRACGMGGLAPDESQRGPQRHRDGGTRSAGGAIPGRTVTSLRGRSMARARRNPHFRGPLRSSTVITESPSLHLGRAAYPCHWHLCATSPEIRALSVHAALGLGISTLAQVRVAVPRLSAPQGWPHTTLQL